MNQLLHFGHEDMKVSEIHAVIGGVYFRRDALYNHRLLFAEKPRLVGKLGTKILIKVDYDGFLLNQTVNLSENSMNINI